MFWIIGGGALIHSMANASDSEFLNMLSKQFFHAEWNGFHFLDLIFPLFMFISGVAIPFSLGKRMSQGAGKTRLFLKVLKRAIFLVLLGILYNNKFSFDFTNMRYASVLGQIGVAYFAAAILYLYTGQRGQIIAGLFILLSFSLSMMYIPVPGYGAGVLTPDGNLSGYIDRILLPGITYREHYDPQGILLMYSATVISIVGSLTGRLLLNKFIKENMKVLIMIASGIVTIALSLFWNTYYPINKEIWSGSYNLLTIGLSIILMGLFYYIIDIRGYFKIFFPFMLIGLNPVFIYMAERMFNFSYSADFILSGVIELGGSYGQVILTTGVISLELMLLFFMYKRNIIIKI